MLKITTKQRKKRYNQNGTESDSQQTNEKKKEHDFNGFSKEINDSFTLRLATNIYFNISEPRMLHMATKALKE